jgi:hypothetical protein
MAHLATSLVVSCFIVLAVGTSAPESEEADDLGSSRAEPTPPATDLVSPGRDEWAEMPTLDQRVPARPAPMPNDGATRLIVFGGSWCPGCVASVLEDAALAQRYRGRVEVGFALENEQDSAFMASTMARWLSDAPVWSEASSARVKELCGIRFVPAACLVSGDRVLWQGGAADAQAVLDAHLAGSLTARLEQSDAVDSDLAAARAGDPAARERVLAATRGFASRENSIAWDLVSSDEVTRAELVLSLALAQDATNATSGLDFAILDTYALALHKAGDGAAAARVGRRVIAVCEAVGGRCSEERQRAEELIAAAGG